MPSALVLVIDRLGAPHLGPYGNTWIETPAFNRLASESLLVEHALLDTPHLPGAYRSYWTGTHALGRTEQESDSGESLITCLNDSGIVTGLLTDEPHVAEHDLADGFSGRRSLNPAEDRDLAPELQATGLARYFAEAVAFLEQATEPSLLWLHCRGMQGPWDAPESYRNQFVDEDDPQPGHFAQAPHKLLADGYDPDELHSIVCAYAGQVALLDVCLDALLEAAREHPLTDELLILVTSSRGFPLGEHLCVGQPRTLLYRELLHVPLLIRHPAKLQATHRCSRLAQPRDVYATLAEWFGVAAMLPTDGVSPLSAPVSTAPNFAVAVDEDQWGLRTPAWFARFASLPDEPGAPSDGELYLKPDDMWEVNDVSDRCGEVFAELYALAHRLRREGPLSTIPLPEVLWLGQD